MSKYTVNDMYLHSVGAGKRLLSNYSADFWQEYVDNYSIYDGLFRRMFLSFRYFLQNDGDSIDTVTDSFIADVKAHLMINAKKYEELYRVYVITDEELNLTDNYYLEEKMDRDTSHNNTLARSSYTDKVDDTLGSRSDSASVTLAQQTNTDTMEIGAQSNGTTTDIGAQSNSTTTDIGAQTTTTDTDTGAQSNSGSTTKGEQTNTTTNKVAPYDSAVYANESETTVTDGARTDSTSDTIGARHDEVSQTSGARQDSTAQSLGARHDATTQTLGAKTDKTTSVIGGKTDTSTSTQGAQTNSSTMTMGARNDSDTGIGTEDYTLTRKGNIGTLAPVDMLVKHRNFWTPYEFYEMIFKEISKELLLIGGSY